MLGDLFANELVVWLVSVEGVDGVVAVSIGLRHEDNWHLAAVSACAPRPSAGPIAHHIGARRQLDELTERAGLSSANNASTSTGVGSNRMRSNVAERNRVACPPPGSDASLAIQPRENEMVNRVREQARSFTAAGELPLFGWNNQKCRCSLLILNATSELAAAGLKLAKGAPGRSSQPTFRSRHGSAGPSAAFWDPDGGRPRPEGFRPVCRAQPPGPAARADQQLGAMSVLARPCRVASP